MKDNFWMVMSMVGAEKSNLMADITKAIGKMDFGMVRAKEFKKKIKFKKGGFKNINSKETFKNDQSESNAQSSLEILGHHFEHFHVVVGTIFDAFFFLVVKELLLTNLNASVKTQFIEFQSIGGIRVFDDLLVLVLC